MKCCQQRKEIDVIDCMLIYESLGAELEENLGKLVVRRNLDFVFQEPVSPSINEFSYYIVVTFALILFEMLLRLSCFWSSTRCRSALAVSCRWEDLVNASWAFSGITGWQLLALMRCGTGSSWAVQCLLPVSAPVVSLELLFHPDQDITETPLMLPCRTCSGLWHTRLKAPPRSGLQAPQAGPASEGLVATARGLGRLSFTACSMDATSFSTEEHLNEKVITRHIPVQSQEKLPKFVCLLWIITHGVVQQSSIHLFLNTFHKLEVLEQVQALEMLVRDKCQYIISSLFAPLCKNHSDEIVF
ncbi:hypothetical protein EK904_003501 [Melospiza melodia maxima]|nr:hypothetical protein EK904_003501 [Melospiza melodia maxima]